jgi:hypothetical protein
VGICHILLLGDLRVGLGLDWCIEKYWKYFNALRKTVPDYVVKRVLEVRTSCET